jgi:tol-pal system protein YbgF
MKYPWRIATGFVAALILNQEVAADVPSANIQGINRTIMEMIQQIKTLQNEVQQLRGEVELHAHTLNAMKKPRQGADQNWRANDETRGGANEAPMVPPVTPIVAPVVTAPVVTAPVEPPAPQVTTGVEQNVYDNAFSLLRSGSYDEAIQSFRDFLAAYPSSQLAANSQYWIGEAYYVTRRFKEAMPEFQSVVDGYKDSPKTGDALLKIGYIQYEFNKTDESKKSLEEVIARFPESTAAKLASARLAKMNR